jgi:hypothetical protein
MLNKMTLVIISLLCLSGCFPFDGPRPKGEFPVPTMDVEEGNEESAQLLAPEKTGQCIDPPPSSPETDCTTWSYLHSLMVITSGMDDELANSTDIELDTDRLEKEIYPLFVQTQLNCGQWVEPLNDYEPISDLLGMLTILGVETYDYSPSNLIEFLLRGAAQEEFASSAESIGCVKSLFVLFVSYEEND